MKNNKGFSLVELIVVIAIMAILAAVAIPTFATFITKANKAADEDFMAQAKYAIELANAGKTDFNLASVTVVVDANGGFNAVAYNDGSDKSIPESVGNNEADEIVDARAASDWKYTFKGYKGKTVTFVENDAGQWEVSQ